VTDNHVDAAVERYLNYLAGRAESPPDLTNLPATEAARIAALCHAADLLWLADAAPPIEDDPVAAMLGLVPDPGLSLDPAKLAKARKRAHLKPSTIAERLSARGWEVTPSEVFDWQRNAQPDVPPALINAIAGILGTLPETLTSASERVTQPAIDEVITDNRFAALVDRWGQLSGLAPSVAQSSLRTRMLATVRRGDHLSAEQWFAVLEALVEAKERPRHEKHD
jgi:hypothetical protein